MIKILTCHLESMNSKVKQQSFQITIYTAGMRKTINRLVNIQGCYSNWQIAEHTVGNHKEAKADHFQYLMRRGKKHLAFLYQSKYSVACIYEWNMKSDIRTPLKVQLILSLSQNSIQHINIPSVLALKTETRTNSHGHVSVTCTLAGSELLIQK